MLKLKHSRRILLWGLAVAYFFTLLQCCTFSLPSNLIWDSPRKVLSRKFIKDYKVKQEDLQKLQFYLSDQIVLSQGSYKSYKYKAHGLELQDGKNGPIIFNSGLPGKYVRHDEKYFHTLKSYIKKFGKKVPRYRFIIHFDQPPMNLEFQETKDNPGELQLLTRRDNKKNKYYVYYNGMEYECIHGLETKLQIDTRQLPNVDKPTVIVRGAPYEDEEPQNCGTGILPIFIGMGVMLLLAFLLDNAE